MVDMQASCVLFLLLLGITNTIFYLTIKKKKKKGFQFWKKYGKLIFLSNFMILVLLFSFLNEESKKIYQI